MRSNDNFNRAVSRSSFSTSTEIPRLESDAMQRVPAEIAGEQEQAVSNPLTGLRRLLSFFGLLIVLTFATHFMITSGLRRMKTSAFGAMNQVMDGKVNAQVVITGSSRALAHYDPRTLEAVTGLSAFNLGRNGSQTDMQVAFLKAYLAHNRRPEIVIHNLDAFSFVTTHEVFDPVQYVPYLYDANLYDALKKIAPDETRKSRYLPVYGYVVEDMNYTWIKGFRSFWGWSPKEDYFQGFNPRSKKWGDDFKNMKQANPNGVSWEIEPGGVEDVKELIRVCKDNGIQLIFVYSPEYSEMQTLTNNRPEIFKLFHQLADAGQVPLWDYSQWQYASNVDYFQNSQHLNATGAAVFSDDVAHRLKAYLAEHSTSPR